MVGERLRNQEPVERVAVMLRQLAQHAQMGIGDSEQVKPFFRHAPLEILEKPQLAEAAFDGDPPQRGDADDDVVIGVADLVTDPRG